jgi:hypothetical protein
VEAVDLVLKLVTMGLRLVPFVDHTVHVVDDAGRRHRQRPGGGGHLALELKAIGPGADNLECLSGVAGSRRFVPVGPRRAISRRLGVVEPEHELILILELGRKVFVRRFDIVGPPPDEPGAARLPAGGRRVRDDGALANDARRRGRISQCRHQPIDNRCLLGGQPHPSLFELALELLGPTPQLGGLRFGAHNGDRGLLGRIVLGTLLPGTEPMAAVSAFPLLAHILDTDVQAVGTVRTRDPNTSRGHRSSSSQESPSARSAVPFRVDYDRPARIGHRVPLEVPGKCRSYQDQRRCASLEMEQRCAGWGSTRQGTGQTSVRWS